MSTPRQRAHALLRRALDHAVEAGKLQAAPETFALEKPKSQDHGDFACTLAMGLARQERRAPRQIAEDIVASLRACDEGAESILEKVDIAGPGFINMTLARRVWWEAVGAALAAGESYGRGEPRSGGGVNVEYVSANPTGPLHVGHGRGAIIGDVLASLLENAGHRISREYYINDAGRQMQLLGASVYARYLQAIGRDAQVPEDGYQGDYITEVAADLKAEKGDALADAEDGEEQAREFAYAAMLALLKRDLGALGITFDVWFSERELHASGAIEQSFESLKDYLEEREGALWFLSETRELGDTKDRVVVKSDGSKTYFAADIAYHWDKLQRGFEHLIDVWGADHHGYIARMKASIQAMGKSPDALEVQLCQMVNLVRDGEPVKMGKRSGEFITLRDVVDEVGSDATRFFFAMRKADSQMDFDLALAKKHSLDNPVFYVQYGHARICSILRKAEAEGIAIPDFDLGAAEQLGLPEEKALMKRIAELPEMLWGAADAREPHRVTGWLQDAIGDFHSYYTRYKKSEKVISDDAEKTRARLLLVMGLRRVLSNGLSLLKVDAPERMEPPAGPDAADWEDDG